MNLRDYFAAAALQGLLASDGEIDISIATRCAYDFADAMLKMRDRETKASTGEGD